MIIQMNTSYFEAGAVWICVGPFGPTNPVSSRVTSYVKIMHPIEWFTIEAV